MNKNRGQKKNVQTEVRDKKIEILKRAQATCDIVKWSSSCEFRVPEREDRSNGTTVMSEEIMPEVIFQN